MPIMSAFRMFSETSSALQQIAGHSKLRPWKWLLGDRRYALNPMRLASVGSSDSTRQPKIVRRKISVHWLSFLPELSAIKPK
jgi:hypothetical protein